MDKRLRYRLFRKRLAETRVPYYHSMSDPEPLAAYLLHNILGSDVVPMAGNTPDDLAFVVPSNLSATLSDMELRESIRGSGIRIFELKAAEEKMREWGITII